MRTPVAGKRSAVRRLAEDVRRRLEPVERAMPVKLPGYGGGDEGAAAGPASERQRAEPTTEDAAARLDAARERLRATIDPPADPDA